MVKVDFLRIVAKRTKGCGEATWRRRGQGNRWERGVLRMFSGFDRICHNDRRVVGMPLEGIEIQKRVDKMV